MKLNLKTWCHFLGKNNHLVVKLAISFVLVGLAFRLISSRSNQFPDITKTPLVETSNPVSVPGIIEQIHHEGTKDLIFIDFQKSRFNLYRLFDKKIQFLIVGFEIC